MIINDLDILGAVRRPAEYHPLFFADPDGILALPTTFQSLKTISWRNGHVAQTPRIVQLHKLSARYLGQDR